MCGEEGSETADAGAPSAIGGETLCACVEEELVQIPANHSCAQSESCGG